ncbi:putrescine aminotransferase [Paenibacillus rhizosphaerae]|uniref:Putrescine aminotransferase n=1 Tax=Paenibacillus rhizosphaerae TaxID=297318 RepID=A0A839TQV9_9BACL|nr:aspartate aminotransferase family protein [Paenibacillus rhizosphaerae]MBB3129145.1 putrescine aminotransferase [Paenibacillus rhizosphaerae]
MADNQRLTELDRKHILHPTSPIKDHYEQGPSVIMQRGEGIYVYDIDGKQYLDGLSSLWNVNVGHGRQELAQAAMEQMSKLAYSHSFNRFSHEPAIMLAEKVASLAPADLNVCHFTSGGSESNDTVFKLIRHYFKLKGEMNRYKIIARYRAYHGVTMGATSATGIPVFRQTGGPLAGGFVQVAAPYSYRCDKCESCAKGGAACAVQSMEEAILREGPDTVAAIIVEPIQGAGGVIVPPPGYMKEIRRLCDKYGILMIADEVITGFGRTGKWFGMEHEGVVADLMTFAKGITSGYIPLGGVILNDRLHKELAELSTSVLPHGYTYSGHPTACAVALKNLEIIEREDLVANAAAMGQVLGAGLEQLKQDSDMVGNVTYRGLLASVELVEDKVDKRAFPSAKKAAQLVFDKAKEKGLITRAIMIDNTDIIALCPPLTIKKDQVESLIDILATSIAAAGKELFG